MTLRLNLGCGKHPMEGWVNIDTLSGTENNIRVHGMDIFNLPYANDTVDEFYSSHMIEHITHVLPLMDELYRVAKPDARATFLCPYGSSDDAWENPTHVRPMYVGSWGFFGQPNYWREDYGYRADWVAEEVHLHIKQDTFDHFNLNEDNIWPILRTQRNIVTEQTAVLRAQKPAREAKRELQGAMDIVIVKMTPINAWESEGHEVGRLRLG